MLIFQGVIAREVSWIDETKCGICSHIKSPGTHHVPITAIIFDGCRKPTAYMLNMESFHPERFCGLVKVTFFNMALI